MFYVYILEHTKDKSWYIGYTEDLKRRLKEHQSNKGSRTTSLKNGKYKLIYYEAYLNKTDALFQTGVLDGRTFAIIQRC
jgi:putative endonuclease